MSQLRLFEIRPIHRSADRETSRPGTGRSLARAAGGNHRKTGEMAQGVRPG